MYERNKAVLSSENSFANTEDKAAKKPEMIAKGMKDEDDVVMTIDRTSYILHEHCTTNSLHYRDRINSGNYEKIWVDTCYEKDTRISLLVQY